MTETKHTKFNKRAAALAVASCMSLTPLFAEAAGLGKLTVLSGLGQTGASFCSLFGTTKPLDAAGFAAANVDRATWLRDWNDSVDSAVRAHTLLRVDGDRLKAVAAKAATPS